ncbi:MAG TPA: homoserine dehydrogenase, partial [Candidatus Goldiibacteriota bacterium]|nr:homoserine dehydrogenase [Candidatus Goldiibacteriota bacterium]
LEKMSFNDALKEARSMGFAEADPYLDISGMDSMHKIIVLSNLSFGTVVKEKDVYVEGINNINSMDVQFADELGYVMKLLAIASVEQHGLNVRVHPVFVSKNNLIASVNYEYNAIYVQGNAAGSTMFYGKGAGEMPTASAVLSDVIQIAKNIADGKRHLPDNIQENKIKICPIGKIKSKYYIRFNVVDKAGVLAKISGVLGNNNISIETVIQKARHSTEKVPVVIMTYDAMEENFIKAIKKINLMKDIVKEKTVFYRVIN